MADLHILLLAAGASSRMRGKDKLLEQIDGLPLLRQVAMRALACDLPLWICLPDQGPRLTALAGLTFETVIIPEPWRGISASLQAGIAAIPKQAAVMVLLADMPEITSADMQSLIAAWRINPMQAHRGASAKAEPGHPVIIPSALRPALMALSGDQGARGALGPDVVLVPLPQAHALTDLDTAADWQNWRQGHQATKPHQM